MVQPSKVLQDNTQVVVRLGVVRLQVEGPTITSDRLLQLALLLQEVAQVVVGLGKVGFEFECPAVGGNGFVRLALFLQGIAQVDVDLGKVGLQLQRPAIGGDRFVEPLKALEGVGQVNVEDRRVALQRDRASDGLDGNCVPAHLVCNHAEKMEGVGMVRLDGEDLPIALLGGLQAASLMVLDGNRKGFRDAWHEADYVGADRRP